MRAVPAHDQPGRGQRSRIEGHCALLHFPAASERCRVSANGNRTTSAAKRSGSGGGSIRPIRTIASTATRSRYSTPLDLATLTSVMVPRGAVSRATRNRHQERRKE
jgi:hypothetical protein